MKTITITYDTHLKKGTGRNSGDLPGLSEMSDHKKGSPEQ